ncbi:hypothetical protein COY32_04705 [candidate division WWE3 bacterium CG_4_10_14_0_2_um_filter_41_14]|uniref:Uncharacterized protein n=1 Tax=candidate division WWE3 bacterium CG_4_10_14_0_2_um_filter_41_14 TaxID=1975072 RepID=A0A2M7THP8_UNCKA|nr:MAG: hypothetical protein COY32_04705 [candidate division WWE3 bacterium CG_4_10_14_0_2_um_filter_41_14]
MSKSAKIIAICAITTILLIPFVFINYLNPIIHRLQAVENPQATKAAFVVLREYLTDFYPALVKELPNTKILYQQMDNGIEGYVVPAEISESKQNIIYINDHFQKEPAVLTAIVIVHEMTHVLQFKNGSEHDCVEKEVTAFTNEAYFYAFLDTKDRNTLLYAARKFEDPVSKMTVATAQILDKNITDCGAENTNCWIDATKNTVRNLVLDSETYRKNCNVTE